jgi:phenylacetate-CoA ligase
MQTHDLVVEQRPDLSRLPADPGRNAQDDPELPRSPDQLWHRSLYLLLQRLRGRPVGACVRRLQVWERMSRLAFEGLVQTRLEESLRYAHRYVPLYSTGVWRAQRRMCSNGEDIRCWPVLEREIVRTRMRALLASRAIPGRFYRTSSHSTGSPVRVAVNPQSAAWSWASEYRAMLWHGVPIGVKTLMLVGVHHPMTDWAKNCKVFRTGTLTRGTLDAATRYLMRAQPVLCSGLPSAVTQFARYVRAEHPGARQVLVPFVKVGGEQLYPFQRAEIQRHLGARVVQFYGCTEVGAIAGECPHGSLHIFAENVHVEIFHGNEPAPPGEVGDIVLTSLTNRAMPLVRYRVGDRGRIAPEPCPCGLPHPVLTDLTGRTVDRYATADDRQIHASALGEQIGRVMAAFSPAEFRNLVFEQVRPDWWRVLVERDHEIGAALASALAEAVRVPFGVGCRVDVERVPFIPRERSGKFRYYRRDGGELTPPTLSHH